MGVAGAGAGERAATRTTSRGSSVLHMTAQELADQASELAAKLKPGTWDAVQALALVSIAQSLASQAQQESSP